MNTMADLAFPWIRRAGAQRLAAFIDDLWGAAGSGDGIEALDAIEKVVAEYRPASARHSYERTPAGCPFTETELEFIALLAQGETQAGVARALSVSMSTVQARLKNLYDTYGFRNVTHAVTVCAHFGWLPADTFPMPKPYTERTPQQWRRVYRQSAAELRACRHTWLSIGPYRGPAGSHRSAERIRKGFIADFRPAGSFEADPAFEDGNHIVRVRYIGEPTSSKETAS